MPSTLANHTIACIRQARRTRDAVSLPEVIRLIEELSSRAFSISVEELADLISHDTLVTAKIIQAANTFGFNPFGLPVTTISQAIHVVGFNKIRNLALSVLLLENARHGEHPEAQRESAALALCSGLIARSLAAHRPAQDAEQAFVFACLRHYGRLMLTTFLTDEFRQVQERPVAESEADACRRVFGLSPLELTSALLEESRLPRPILRCLQDLPPAQLASSTTSTEEELAAITQFSATMGELVLSPRIGANTFGDEMARLRGAFGEKLHLPENAVAELVGTVDHSLRAFARAYGNRSVAPGIAQRIAERAAQAEPQPVLPDGIVIGNTPPPQPPAPPPPPPAPEPVRPEAAIPPAGAVDPPSAGSPGLLVSAAPSPAPAPPPAIPPAPPAVADVPQPAPHGPPASGVAFLTECLLQLAEMMTASPLDLRAMEHAVLIAVRHALELRDCLLFHREGSSRTFSSSAGIGDLFDAVRGRPLIDADRRDVFGIALTRRDDVLIRDTTDPKLRPFLPEWLVGAGPVSSFILLPLHNETGSFAMIVGTRTAGPAIQPQARELQLLKALRHHLSTARRLSGLR